MTTHSSALERTLKSDPVLASPEHAATVQLARALAKELDASTSIPTRTLAAHVSVLSQLRRVIRDAQAERAKAGPPKAASRLAQMKDGAKP